MHWKKLGLVYGPDGSSDWAKSHAIAPTPIAINETVIRVFVTFLDALGVGRPGYVDVAANDPTQVLKVSPNPLLDIGEPGTFDENGVLACSIVVSPSGAWYMYYVGFELGMKMRYRMLTGLAVSRDYGESFERASQVPILERTDKEPFFRCAPFCSIEGRRYRLWYVGGGAWTTVAGKSVPIYDIRYAESKDGIRWPPKGALQIGVSNCDEHGFGRPYVIPREGGGYRMFYSVRRRSVGGYRLGYAESDDGFQWNRMDEELNLGVSAAGFDSDAIMYAAPFYVAGQLYLFYNGNDFGKDGFAVAIQQQT